MKRQKLHLKAPDNWVNDPNGFIYYKGYYHLFYQYFPYEPRWGTMHWGHAVSRDLVTWEHKGLALYPTLEEDRNGCFSGSAIEADGKMYLVYTGVRYEVVNPEDPHLCLDDQFESSQLMISSEDGFTFDNENGKEVIIPALQDPEIGDRTHTRDPKIWKGKKGWLLIVGSTVRGKYGEALFYHSTDLHKWQYLNKVSKGPGCGWMWECPDYFETEGGGVLLVSAMGLTENGENEKNHSICFKASFDEESGEMKLSDDYQFLDYGMDLYAPQTALDKEGRRTVIAWVRMPKITDEGWIGMFCSPRVAEIRNGHIYFRLHPDIRRAYSRKISDVSQASEDGYMARFSLEDGESVDIGGYVIKREGSRIATDRSAVFPDSEGAHVKSVTPELKEGFQLEVLVDKNLIEVFANDGEYVVSSAVYGLKKRITCKMDGKIELYTSEI